MRPTSGEVLAERGIIDINAELGPPLWPQKECTYEDLADSRARHGIRCVLVRERAAVSVSRAYGRDRLERAIAHDASMLPVATATISVGGDLVGDLRAWAAAGARAVWVEPTEPWSTQSEAARQALASAATPGLPLLIPHRASGDASAIGALTVELGVPVVLVGVHYARYADAFAAAQRYPHLRFETSSLATYRAIDVAAAAIGHERILFGSGMPARTPASALNAVLLSGLGPSQQEAVLAGNASRLFGISRGPVDLRAPRLPARALDVHTHFFPSPWPVPQVSDGELPARLRAFGIRATISSSVPALLGDLENGNARAVTASVAASGQLAYLVADPNDLDAARGHLRRWLSAPGVMGVKVHCHYAGCQTDSDRVRALFGVLAEHGRPVKIHNMGPGWEAALLAVARRHPKLPIVIAHAGLGIPSASAATVVANADRVYVELSSSLADIRECRSLVSAIPPERLLFGSDAPLMDPGFVLGTYQDLGLEPDVLDRVFWDNAVALFGEPGAS
ncbi:MAG TPA: amidohydrolase family protein [Candidatus Limnocylindria bacterium]|nr:amidohydrolase family protein [Candidatus Limnocylindria bacterium]